MYTPFNAHGRKEKKSQEPGSSRNEKSKGAGLKKGSTIKAEFNRRENKDILQLISKTKQTNKNPSLWNKIHKGKTRLWKTDHRQPRKGNRLGKKEGI